MSQFHKLLLTVIGAIIAIYLLTCSSFFHKAPQKVNQEELINYVFSELDYELTYGDSNINQEAFIKETLQKTLKKRNAKKR